MPKRKGFEKIERYNQKIRRIELRQQRRRSRIINSDSDSTDSEVLSDNEQNQQDEVHLEEEQTEITQLDNPDIASNTETGQDQTKEPELDSDILNALGEAVAETPKFGPKIHEKLAHLWLPILRKGLEKEAKDKLLKQHVVPENCGLLRAPKLNPEISAAVSEASRLRDKRVEGVQQQLGAGITALNKGLELLLDNNKDKLEAIRFLSEGCRLLCDLHYIETEARKKFITPGLDKSFLNIVQDVERDDMLFGNKLSEKIKASKVIEKQGLQIKKVATNAKSSSASTPAPSTSRQQPRYQSNWMGPPPRYSSNKGGRGGPRKTAPAGRRAAPATQTKPANQSKQRASTQHQ